MLEWHVLSCNVADVGYKLPLVSFLPVDHDDSLVTKNRTPVTRNGLDYPVLRYTNVGWRRRVALSWKTKAHVNHRSGGCGGGAILSFPVSNAVNVVHFDCQAVRFTEGNQI